MLESGADKIIISSALYEKNNWILSSAETFGSQCLIACLDYKILRNQIKFFSNQGTNPIEKSLEDLVLNIKNLQIGEIMVNSIDKDGSKTGFDLFTFKKLNALTTKPLIVCGGYGSPKDIKKLWQKESVSICIGNVLNHKEHSVAKIKSWIKKNTKFQVRSDKEIDYRGFDNDLLY